MAVHLKINISRHAKRRMQLYRLEQDDVLGTVKAFLSESVEGSGLCEATNVNLAEKYGYPLKIVFSIEGDEVTVITAYPIKKERLK